MWSHGKAAKDPAFHLPPVQLNYVFLLLAAQLQVTSALFLPATRPQAEAFLHPGGTQLLVANTRSGKLGPQQKEPLDGSIFD